MKKCNSAMRVAGLAVFIVWRYNKPRVHPTHADIKRFIAFADR